MRKHRYYLFSGSAFGVIITALVMAFMCAIADSVAQDYSLIEDLIDGRNDYQAGVIANDINLIDSANDLYLEFHQSLERDETLATLLRKYKSEATYGRGWCFYRLAELTGDCRYYDSASVWFAKPFEEINVDFDHYRYYIKADAIIRSAHLKAYSYSMTGPLPVDSVPVLLAQLREVSDVFSRLENDHSIAEHLRMASAIRRIDSEYEKAIIWELAGDTAQAHNILETIDYVATLKQISSRIPPEFQRLAEYSQMVVIFRLFLYTRSDQYGDVLRDSMSLLGSDSGYYRAHAAFIDTNYTDAEMYYQRMREYESKYWLGYLSLIQNIETLNTSVLRSSHDDFKEFAELSADNVVYNTRIFPLRQEAIQISRNLGLALGAVLPDDFRDSLNLRLVRFLTQIGAVMVGENRGNFIEALEYMLMNFSGLSDNEGMFYYGVIKSLQADAEMGDASIVLYREAAETLDRVTGDYEGEAKYIRARCLANAGDYADAEALFLELVDYPINSMRALLYLAKIYREDRVDDACKISHHIINVIDSHDVPDEYKYYRKDAQTIIDEYCDFDNPSSNIVPDIPGMYNLRVPESLSVITDTIDGRPFQELITYETLERSEFIRQSFLSQVTSQIRKNSQPKKILYPVGGYDRRPAFRDVFRPFDTLSAGIVDLMPLDVTWDAYVMLLGVQDGTPTVLCDSVVVNEVTGEKLGCDGDGYFVVDSLGYSDALRLRLTPEGYYPEWVTLTCDMVGKKMDTLLLTELSTYEPAVDADVNDGMRQLVDGMQPNPIFAMFCYPDSTNVASLAKFHDRDSLRDMAYDPTSGDYLVTNSNSGTSLLRYTKQCPPDNPQTVPLTFRDNDSLMICPQGLDVDVDGTIYVADWGNHRIAVFDGSGRHIRSVGAFSATGESGVGDSLRIAYPYDVTIVRDTVGVTFGASTFYRQPYLVISDWYGRTLCTLDGRQMVVREKQPVAVAVEK